MNFYTYSIFDSGEDVEAWPHKNRVEIFVDNDRIAVAGVSNVLRREAQKLTAADGYSDGDTIHAIVWDANGDVLAHLMQVVDIPQK